MALDVFGNSYYSGDLPLSGPDRELPSSPEFDLLRACSAVELTETRLSQLANCDRQTIDWKEFIRLAEHHGVLPLVSKNLLAHAPGLHEQVARSLQSAYETNIRRNLWFAAELARIANHFERKNLRAVPYKGAILAESVYGDLALRNFNDLDFLTASADFERGKQALAELGYHPSDTYRPEIERFWLRFGYERSFDGAAGKYLVELQWRILPRFYAVDLPTEELLERAVTASIGGQFLPTLSTEDLLLVLCLHAAKHLWMRLIWISDIAETVRTQNIDYNVLISRARALGITRIVGVSFWLAQNVREMVLPKFAEEIVNADLQVKALGQLFADRLQRSATYDFESSEYFRLILKLRERQLDRWRYFGRLVWAPGENDFAAVRLPEALFPLYRAVRLTRLVCRMLWLL